MKDNPEWDNRFKVKVWTFENENWYHKYRLYITDINGNEQELMQMAELELYGEVGEGVYVNLIESPEVRVFPNPAHDHLSIEWSGQISNPEISLFDVTGRKVYHVSIASTGESAIRLNTETYRAGLYILQIRAENGFISRKIVIE